MSHGRYDVVIVGGGMAGSLAALSLARLRLNTAVVEAVTPKASSQPSFDERCTALSYASVRILNSLGLWTQIEGEATPIRKVHVSERGSPGVTCLDATEMQVNALGYVIPNRVLGRTLLKTIATTSRIDRYCPANALGTVAAGEDWREIRLKTEDGEEALQARLLVIADGADSPLRDSLGLAVSVREYHREAIVSSVRVAKPRAGVAYERFLGLGSIALLPRSNDMMGLVWVVPEGKRDEFLEISDEEFMRDLQKIFGWRLGRFLAAGARRHYPLRQVWTKTTITQRAVLIGNAAQTLHPVAAQGFNLAVRDIAMLTEAIGSAPDGDIGQYEVLSAIQRRRERDRRRTEMFTNALITVFDLDLPGVAAARSLGLLGVELLRPLARCIAHQGMGLAGRPLPALVRGVRL